MVEGGDVDWANHGRDYAWMVGAAWRFDEAVKAAIAFVDTPGDDIDWSNTLVIVTSDHTNGALRRPNPPGLGDLPTQVANADPTIVFDYPDKDVRYLSREPGSHTNELVTLYARGAGYEHFYSFEGLWYPGYRLIDNTQVNQAMLDALGLF